MDKASLANLAGVYIDLAGAERRARFECAVAVRWQGSNPVCGLTGFIDLERRLAAAQLAGIAQRMSDSIAHRGPDDAATWVDAEARLAFGFRRLSIIDVSPLGRQPMHSASGRFVIVYNGEIYNAPELRRAARGRGPGLSRPLRHRGDARRLRALGHRGARSTRSPACSPSPCGTGRAAACSLDPRPARQEAALLRQDRRHVLLRLAAQELLPPSRLAGRDRSRQPHRLHALRLRPGAALDLQGVLPACARANGSRCAAARWSARRLYWDARAKAAAALAEPMELVGRGGGRALRGAAVRGGARGGCSPMCRSAPSCPAASTARPSSR